MLLSIASDLIHGTDFNKPKMKEIGIKRLCDLTIRMNEALDPHYFSFSKEMREEYISKAKMNLLKNHV